MTVWWEVMVCKYRRIVDTRFISSCNKNVYYDDDDMIQVTTMQAFLCFQTRIRYRIKFYPFWKNWSIIDTFNLFGRNKYLWYYNSIKIRNVQTISLCDCTFLTRSLVSLRGDYLINLKLYSWVHLAKKRMHYEPDMVSALSDIASPAKKAGPWLAHTSTFHVRDF